MISEAAATHIRRLTPDDAALFMSLRSAALLDAPFAFGSTPDDDRARSINFVREAVAGPGQAVFGAFSGTELVGVVGIYRDGSAKGAHKCDLWGMYVSPGQRSTGVGRALATAALGFARSLKGVSHVYLSVSERAPDAIALYQKLGFVTWGVEPAALRVGGAEVAEHHMVRALDGPFSGVKIRDKYGQ